MADIGGVHKTLDDPTLFSAFTNLGGGMYSVEVLESALTTPVLLTSINVMVYSVAVPITTGYLVNKHALFIERAAASISWTGIDSTTFAAGAFPTVADLNWSTLTYNLEQAYITHGNKLTAETITRIINGMHYVTMTYSYDAANNADEFHLVFAKNVTGDPYYQFKARTASGMIYLTTTGRSHPGAYVDVSFQPNLVYPMIIDYTAQNDSMDMYYDEPSGEKIPDFELVYVPLYQ